MAHPSTGIQLEARIKGHTVTVPLTTLSRSQRTAASKAVNDLGRWITAVIRDGSLVCTVYSPQRQKKNLDRMVRSAQVRVPKVIRRVVADKANSPKRN